MSRTTNFKISLKLTRLVGISMQLTATQRATNSTSATHDSNQQEGSRPDGGEGKNAKYDT